MAEKQQELQDSWFSQALAVLRAAYPGSYLGTPAEWSGTVKFYTRELRKHPAESLKAAFLQAPRRFPDRFPTLGQLAGLVAEERLKAIKAKKQARLESEHGLNSRRIGAVGDFREAGTHGYRPPSENGSESNSDDSRDPECSNFTELALAWEKLAYANGSPNGITPYDEGARRMKQISKLWSK